MTIAMQSNGLMVLITLMVCSYLFVTYTNGQVTLMVSLSQLVRFVFLRIGITAAILSETETMPETRNIFTKCEIGTEMTEVQECR